ncbi:peptidylprolyl isomerase [Actinophytocola xanthii]|uniref:Peptidyl-prolyl cis-trans isomerase n=1 Tax=Actinophytocola xanthii TaxID=1912961 RepID=A0A1Q8CYZ0_9PSEU|nr:peptidylprolyl isomerase [Actinophytocola xanthii]OLF19581.1 peptidyl-prolyl cis-trans isomerase [Actinophytocola xanthii]
MPSNEQRRQAAKRKLERQLARRAERAKRRRIWGVSLTVIVVVGVVVLVYWLANLGPEDSEAATENTEESTPATSEGPCAYAESTGEDPPKDVGMPEDPEQTPSTGTVTMTLKTNQGTIPLTLDRAKAPCTVQSMEHLAKEKYFDGTTCHRLTSAAGLKVLQCGDPKGDGTGGPGYTVPDELPTDLANSPGGGELKTYPRGVLAMANGGPDTGGSQFFMVYGDSSLPPNYTVFGTVEASGLTVLDKVAQGGITPGTSPEDGAPKKAVTIESATLAG